MKNEETEGNVDRKDMEEVKRPVKEEEIDLPGYGGQRLRTEQEIEENRRRIIKLLER